MLEIRGFTGKLNLDDNPYRLPKGDHTDALNITRDAQGTGQDEAASNIVGNQLVSDTLPTGINKVIGNYQDRTRNRQYYFTWNDTNYHRISYYDATTNSIQLVMENLTDTGGVNVLNFDPSYRINHIDIVYRDEDGDLLFWTDGLNQPRKINVKTAITGGYGTIISSYLDVAKEPPATPPICVYQDDLNVTVNNLNNKLFKFKYRYVFDDLEKSTTSAQSEVPIPKNYTDQTIATNPTKNSSIFILMDSGAANVTKIEILGSESLGETWSDFFLITVLDKTALNIRNNNTAQFSFYNNQAYSTIPVNESIQPFDNVPLKAYAQSLPNGNVLDYGAITEGYDLVEGEYITTIQTNNLRGGINQTAIIEVYANDLPTGSLKLIVKGTPSTGDNFNIKFNRNTTFQNLLVVATGATPTTASLKSDIATVFGLYGYTISIDSDLNQIVTYPSATLTPILPTQYTPTVTAQNKNSELCYDWFSRYSYGVVYFDEKGRTNGVVYTNTSSFQTQAYDETSPTSGQPCYIPNQQFAIYNRPPLWASYFEIVRTKNLSKSKSLYWVSERTLKDGLPDSNGFQYGYIAINNLTQYAIDNGAKTLGYEFTPGDRIRFVKLYDGSSNTAQKYGYSDNRDYPIATTVTNPTINGLEVLGQVIKILLPNNLGSTFDFGTNYDNYLIELYTPSTNFSNESNLYYEFGEKYAVGNPNTINAYHFGMTQNQTSNLSLPSLYNFYKGDSYFRYRTMPIGGAIVFQNNPVYVNTANYGTGGQMVSTNNNNPIYFGQSWIGWSSGQWNINNFPLIYTSAVSFNIRLKGFLTFTPDRDLNQGNILIVSNNVNAFFLNSVTTLYTNPNLPPLINGQEKTVFFDQIITLPGAVGQQGVLWALSGIWGNIKKWEINVLPATSITQGIIDSNFSDNYDSAASPNGRAWVYNPNAAQEFNPTLIRYGGEYQFGTTINNINRFYEENFDLYDRSRGAIKKMFIEGRSQYVFQQFDVGVVTVLTQIVRDTAGNPLSAESDKLLNKIVYPYIGGYGIGDVPESFAYGKHSKYFVDSNKGVVCRLSADGITPLSILYKTNAFFVAKLAGFQNNLNTTIPETGTPTVYGAFDAYTNKYIICMDEINRDDLQQPAYTLSFLESRDNKEGFESFLSFHPENIGALNNTLISFKDGEIWLHNNDTHCNFYGVQYDAYIETAFNDQPLEKKTYTAVMETANTIWHCPVIKSQLNSYGTTPQQTYIVTARFALLEGQYYSAILRDQNSPGGIINGDTMHGNYLIVRFQKDAAADFYYINSVSLNYINSPLNTR